MTGMLACCARVTTGHIVAPPSPAMNARRFVCPIKLFDIAVFLGHFAI
jgi:hypothetical protein